MFTIGSEGLEFRWAFETSESVVKDLAVGVMSLAVGGLVLCAVMLLRNRRVRLAE